ncbi:MAG TPA: SMC-Scp complex subunit ScpB [Gammaproteobacteria bacterium]|nr:SMC-Scp complex subunit ScpB [Gammaproteobacteria bacterium]
MTSEFPSLQQIIEGAILAADSPLGIDHMISLFEGEQPTRAQIRDVLKEIETSCEGRGFELKKVSSGYRFQVRTEYGEWVSRLWEEKPQRYSRALLETLALIAYRQPITRGDIEEVRGVAVSTNIIRALLEREWIRVVGHRDVPGRPATYATTKNFLDYFNLSSLDELPTLSEIKDLDKVNEELDLEENVVEARVIELEDLAAFAPDPVSDEELDQVSEDVKVIESNIRNLFPKDGDESVADGEIEDDVDAKEVDEPEVEMQPESEDSEGENLEAENAEVESVGQNTETEPVQERLTKESEQFANVPQEILDAAFAEDDSVEDKEDDK